MTEEIEKINGYIEILSLTENMIKIIPDIYINLEELSKIKLSVNKIKLKLINNLIQLNKNI